MEGCAGLCIYYNYDFTINIHMVEALVNKANQLSDKYQLSQFQCMFSDSDRFTRYKKVTKKNFVELFKELRKKTFESISFYDSFNEDFNISLTFDLFAPEAREDKGRYSQDLYLIINNIVVENEFKQFVEFGKFAWSVLDCCYGFIYAAPNCTDVQSELTAIPISPVEKELSEKEIKREEELDFYQDNRQYMHKYIRKAYWGNFLNKNHIVAIGGIDFVKKSSLSLIIEEIANDGIYIQLARSLMDFEKSDFQMELKELDRLLQAIKLRKES